MKNKSITVGLCLLLIFGNVKPAGAKDNWFLPGAEGFTPPISRPVQSSRGYSDSRPARGARGQNPGGSACFEKKIIRRIPRKI